MESATALLLANTPAMQASTPTRFTVTLTDEEMSFYKKYVQFFEGDNVNEDIVTVLFEIRLYMMYRDILHRPVPRPNAKTRNEENFNRSVKVFQDLRRQLDVSDFEKVSVKTLSALHYKLYVLAFTKYRQMMEENNHPDISIQAVENSMALHADNNFLAGLYYGFQALLYYIERWDEVIQYDTETYGTRFVPIDSLDIITE